MPYPLSLEQRWQHVKRHEGRAVSGGADSATDSATDVQTPPASSAPPDTTSDPPASTTQQASTTQSHAQSQSQSASGSATHSASSAQQTSSQASKTASTANSSQASSAPTTQQATSTQNTATITSATNEIPTTMSQVNLPSLTSGQSLSVGRLTSNGEIYTVTNVVSGSTPTGVHSSDSSSSGFFANKGAVAATFIIVALAGTAIVLVTLMQINKRRRRRRFEREVAMAARHTRKPPSFDEDEGSYPQMSQAAGAPGASTNYNEPGAGYGAQAPPPPTHLDDAPASSDYYNAAPYNASGGYPPQPVPVYSGSSNGHEAQHDYSQAYYDNGAVAYGQAYGHPADGYNGGYAQQGYGAGGYDAYGQHPQQGYAYSEPPAPSAPAAQAAPAAAAGGQYAGRNLTPGDASRGKPGRKSLLDDTSVKSYYSEEEEIAMPPRGELRVANE